MKLGNKFNKSIKKLGHKIDKGAHRIGSKAHGFLDNVNKSVSRGDVIIRKADNTLNKIHELGGSSIPYVGTAMDIARGVLDKSRKASKQIKDASQSARKHANDLEKFNSRKLIKEASESEAGSSFV